MKILLVLFSAFIFLKSASGQGEPKILLNEGELGDTTVAMINGRSFGFRIDWGQGDKDTCKYEIIHGRGTAPFSRSSGILIGRSHQFRMYDIRRVMPGDRLVFNLKLNGQSFSRSYHVISTKASESRPWFFNIYFIYRGDTLPTNSYKTFLSYRKDSVNTQPPSLERDTFPMATRFYFSDPRQLPKWISIKFKGRDLFYDFIQSDFFHGDIYISYTEQKKRPKEQRWDYNAEIKFFDHDADGWGRSQQSYK